MKPALGVQEAMKIMNLTVTLFNGTWHRHFKTKFHSGVILQVIRQHSNVTASTHTERRWQDRREVKSVFFTDQLARISHVTSALCLPSLWPHCLFTPSSPFQDKGFIPEWDFLLWELHVIPDEESLRVLSLPIPNNAPVELDDRWQPACRHQKAQSVRKETQIRVTDEAVTPKSYVP